MKKFYFYALALIPLAASCTNEQLNVPETTGNAINFGTYLGRDVLTRASVLTTDNLNSFGVFASYTGENNYTSSDQMNFMNNQEVTKSGSDWTYTPVKYWPNNPGDKISFFAYAPYDNTTAVSGTTKTVTANPTLGSTEDLVVAEALKDQTKQTTTGKVLFTFKHALSRIGLNVEAQVDLVNGDQTGSNDNGTTGNGTLDDKTTIKVTEVKLVGKFDTEANINLLNGTWSGVESAISNVEYIWGYDNFISSVADKVTIEKQKLNADNSYAMIIPQKFEGENKIKLVVKYTVTTTDNKLDDGKSAIENTITSDAFNFNFEQGKAYMFNLHLGMTSVKLDASVSSWDEVTPGTVVNLPINS